MTACDCDNNPIPRGIGRYSSITWEGAASNDRFFFYNYATFPVSKKVSYVDAMRSSGITVLCRTRR